MKSSIKQLKFIIFLIIVGILVTFILYRPGAYYYFRYEENPQYIEFQHIHTRPLVINGVINYGYEFTYGTGKTIFTGNKFSIFGYDNLNKFIYKLSEEKAAICNSKFLGNCLFSEGEGVKEFLQFLIK